MRPYLLILCGACLVSALSAGYLMGSRPDHRASRLAVLMLLASAWWSLCEIAWNLAPDPETAMQRIRLSAPGWCFIGPIVLHLFLEATQVPWPRVWRMLPVLYGSSLAFAGLTWFTPWMFSGVESTSWGWAYVPGPLYPLYFAAVMAGVVPAVLGVGHAFRTSYSPAERQQRPWILIGIGAPLILGSVTDGLLPQLGVQLPRMASTSFAVMGAVAVLSMRHYGYSFLTPTSFAEEIYETLSEGVALLQWDERIRRANRGLSRLSGYSRGELLGKRVSEILSLSPAAVAGQDGADAELIRADGERFPVTLSSSQLRDRRGEPVGFVLVVRDLREVADLRRRLLLSARLAAVGELAAGIAHEINNPLAFIRANLTHLQDHWKRADSALTDSAAELRDAVGEGHELIEESLEGVSRAADIVRGVRVFSHAGGGPREPADLNQLIEEVLRMAETELRGRARIELDFSPLPPLACAPQELSQVFLNLVLNAGHAIQEGGTIRIETSCEGSELRVLVQDDGCGIDPQIIDRVFDPFFTTKKVGEGTGLGLGIAYQIVRSHEGEISVDSRPGRGARFEVRLPL